MKKFIVFIMIIGLSIPAITQISPYLEKGKSGLGLSAGLEQGTSFKGFQGKLGGSIKGILDIEAKIISDSYDRVGEGLITDDGSSFGMIGSATWWMLRKQPSPFIDVNVGLTGGIESYSFSNYRYIHNEDGNTVDYTGYLGGFLGFETRIKIRMNDNWSLMPGYSVGYDMGSEKRTELNQELTDPYSGIMSRLSISLAKHFNKGNVLYFSVDQYFDTFLTGNYFEFSVGFLLSQK